MFDPLKSFIRHPGRWLRLIRSPRAQQGNADLKRWSDLGNFNTAWDDRSCKLGSRVLPGASVLDFGCGRGAVRKALSAGTDYLGSDIVARSPDTLVWDLNNGAPPLERDFDVAIFSGVLEYVADIPVLLGGLRPRVTTILASYASIGEVPDVLTRRECGWINDFTQDRFVSLFESSGYHVAWRDSWIDSRLYQFERDA